MQKSVSLQLKPGHLITTGLWKRTRNPNYFGEFLIYSSWNLISAAIFGSVIICEWIPNMLRYLITFFKLMSRIFFLLFDIKYINILIFFNY
jgi:steroid 5-alpha reductase family enzyme